MDWLISTHIAKVLDPQTYSVRLTSQVRVDEYSFPGLSGDLPNDKIGIKGKEIRKQKAIKLAQIDLQAGSGKAPSNSQAEKSGPGDMPTPQTDLQSSSREGARSFNLQTDLQSGSEVASTALMVTSEIAQDSCV